MTNITLRSVKGSPLTNNEVDSNFSSLNDYKVEQTDSSGSALIPSGTTAQRDASPSAGMFRYNTELSKFEGYITDWGEIGGSAVVVSASAPVSPDSDALWIDTTDATLNWYFIDSDQTAQWVTLSGETGPQGGIGNTGDTGATGRSGTLKYLFSTNTAASDPGAGVLRYNNATPGSVTAIYVDNDDADGNTVSALLDTWDVGQIEVRKQDDPTKYGVFSVTNVADTTGYRTFTVSAVSTGTLPADNDSCYVSFKAKGDTGNTGATGPLDSAQTINLIDSDYVAARSLSTGKAIAMAIVFG